jgi:hypothetical protein
MKKYIPLAILGLWSSSLHGLTLTSTFTNLQGIEDRESNIVLDNTGTQVAGGYIAIGVFNNSNGEIGAIGSGADLDAAFYQFGSATTFGGFAGSFSDTAMGDPDALYDGFSPYTGKNLYIVIGDQASLTASNQFLVWDSGVVFDNGTPTGGPDTVTLDADSGTLAVGRKDLHTFDLGVVGGSAAEVAFTLQTIPEPSSTVLLGLGGLSFFLRRRR